MIPEQIYNKYGPEEYTELWKFMTEEDVYEFRDHVCMQCVELGGGWGRYIAHKTCDYVAHHGRSRRCSPFSCIDVGYFQPRRKMSGSKEAYLDAMRDYVETWLDKMRERKRKRENIEV